MTFPTIQTQATSSTNTAGTNHVVTLPSGITAGDLILILMDIGSTSATLNAHADYSEILDENLANGLKILYRKATGGESNPTIVSSASTRDATVTYRISGAIDPATQLPEIGTTASGTGTTPDPPTCTPTGGAKDYLWITFCGSAGEQADDGTYCTAFPTSFADAQAQKTCGIAGTNLGGLIAAATRQQNASSQNPGTFTVSETGGWRAQTIAVHPAADLGSGTLTGAGTLSADGSVSTPTPPTLSALTQAVGGRVSWVQPGYALASVILAPAVAITGSANLTGAGTLTATATQTVTATLTGAGTLTADGTVPSGSTGPAFTPLRQPAGLRLIPQRTGHVQFTPRTPPGIVQATAVLTGAGTLSATSGALTTGPALSPLTQPVGGRVMWIRGGHAQATQIRVVAVTTVNGDATLTGTGSLTATAAQSATATLTGAGVLTAVSGGTGVATLTGAGSLTASAVIAGSATLTGAGTLTASGAINGSATLTGAGVLTANAAGINTAQLTGAGVLTATATTATPATLTGAGTLTVTGVVIGSASLTGAGLLTAAGRITGSASLTAAGSLSAVYQVGARSTLTAAGTVTAAGQEIIPVVYGIATVGSGETSHSRTGAADGPIGRVGTADAARGVPGGTT